MIKASFGNFAIITIMAILGILLLKSVLGMYPVKGLSEMVFAV